MPVKLIEKNVLKLSRYVGKEREQLKTERVEVLYSTFYLKF